MYKTIIFTQIYILFYTFMYGYLHNYESTLIQHNLCKFTRVFLQSTVRFGYGDKFDRRTVPTLLNFLLYFEYFIFPTKSFWHRKTPDRSLYTIQENLNFVLNYRYISSFILAPFPSGSRYSSFCTHDQDGGFS